MQASELLKHYREAAGLSQPAAAAQCGVSFSAYEKWERGAKIMPPVLAGLLLMLGAPADKALLAGKVAVARKDK